MIKHLYVFLLIIPILLAFTPIFNVMSAESELVETEEITEVEQVELPPAVQEFLRQEMEKLPPLERHYRMAQEYHDSVSRRSDTDSVGVARLWGTRPGAGCLEGRQLRARRMSTPTPRVSRRSTTRQSPGTVPPSRGQGSRQVRHVGFWSR